MKNNKKWNIMTVVIISVLLIITCESGTNDSGTYAVTLTQGTGYTLTAKTGSASPVTQGGSFTFVFALKIGYTQSTPIVKVNGTAVTLTGGEYTITNITSAQIVTVEGVIANPSYAVIIDPTDITVAKGGKQQFTATVSGTDDPNVLITWELVGITGFGGSTITALTGLLSVSAGETRPTLTVKATAASSTAGFVISETTTVTVGE